MSLIQGASRESLLSLTCVSPRSWARELRISGQRARVIHRAEAKRTRKTVNEEQATWNKLGMRSPGTLSRSRFYVYNTFRVLNDLLQLLSIVIHSFITPVIIHSDLELKLLESSDKLGFEPPLSKYVISLKFILKRFSNAWVSKDAFLSSWKCLRSVTVWKQILFVTEFKLWTRRLKPPLCYDRRKLDVWFFFFFLQMREIRKIVTDLSCSHVSVLFKTLGAIAVIRLFTRNRKLQYIAINSNIL